MNRWWLAGIVGISLVLLIQGISGQNETQCLCLEDVITPFAERTTVRMKLFPDGSGRMLMAEKIGVMWIYNEDFTKQPEPFGNLSHLVAYHSLDCGLQGVALHPNFPEDGRVFVNFIQRELLGDYATLRQYSVYPDNPDVIDMDSEVILIERNRQPNGSSAHSGGEVFFDLEGYLYVIYGDGSQGDPLYISQNRGDFRGKLLRLDIDNVPEGKPYGIPSDNPFVDEEGTLPEIYALGFRQPWTISVDPGDPDTGEGAGRIFVADCGQRSYEEINLVEKGGNYGWSSREGFACYRYRFCDQIGPEVFPIAAYRHEVGRLLGWCAISGNVYRGSLNPGLKNAYIHGDSGSLRTLYAMRESSDGQWSHDELPLCDLETCDNVGLNNTFTWNLVAFGTDIHGEMYLLSSTTSTEDYGARIQRLIDPETYEP